MTSRWWTLTTNGILLFFVLLWELKIDGCLIPQGGLWGQRYAQ